MKTIKRVLVLLIMILVVVIYLTNKDTKIYYVSLGDGLGRGMNANDKIGYGYSDYIKEYLEDIDKLEFYTKQFSDKDKRTTDIINNINDNIEIIEDSKPLTIKKALMHADIITLSTGLNELLYKLQNENLDSYQMYKYIDNLIEDIDDLIDIYRSSLGLNLSCNEVTIKTFCTGFTNAKRATIQANIIFTVMIRIFLIPRKGT